MEGAAQAVDYVPAIVVANSVVIAAGLVAAGRFLAARNLTADVPAGRQVFGEFVLDFFVRKGREMAHGEHRDKVMRFVVPLLASFFLFIFVSNLFGMLPIPQLNMPPTAYYSGTLALALCSVLATLSLSAIFKGIGGAAKHLVWPNPMQWVSEFTDVASLSLRLFGNIGGEHMTLVLVASIVPYGIPLILHGLGIIPAFVQALVFTLLTASFMASAVHREPKRARKRRKGPAAVAPAEPSMEGGTGR